MAYTVMQRDKQMITKKLKGFIDTITNPDGIESTFAWVLIRYYK